MTDMKPQTRRTNRVFKSLHKPLTYLGVERNIYSFTLQDISASPDNPDLKVIVQPADQSAIVAASGPPQFVPAAQLEQSKRQLAAVQMHITQAVDEYKSAYRLVAVVLQEYAGKEGRIESHGAHRPVRVIRGYSPARSSTLTDISADLYSPVGFGFFTA